MPYGRITKLLHSEYRDLVTNESLLIESPFAETTRDGRGLREVALGLTASRLIVASDNLDNKQFWCEKQVDPSIESLQLKSVLPLDCVTLKVFREKKRRALEARKRYYELGGHGCRSRSWNDWCSHVRRFLSDSETKYVRGRACDGWRSKHLYLGPEYEELWDRHYCPKPVVFARASLETIKNDLITPRPTKPPSTSHRKRSTRRVPRFAEGVNENCSHSLYIPVPQSSSSSSSIVTLQQNISPAPHFLRGFGPWSTHFGDRPSLQSRLTQSLANIRRQEPELRLPVSRRQLARATASLASLKVGASTRSSLVFWTTDYWYRPRDAVEVCRDVRRHLNGVFGERRDQCTHRHGTTAQLRKLLKSHHHIILFEIPSTCLSQQLTLIDRDLFTRISINEVRNLARNREPRDAPNFSAWVAFAHRIACLFETEVLKIDRVEKRAMIIVRLIRTAEKCVGDGNFQSASALVAALQSPALFRHKGCSVVLRLNSLIGTSYEVTLQEPKQDLKFFPLLPHNRLKATWSYLNTHHRTRYNAMTKLSKLFANTRSRTYHEAWMKIENSRCSSIPSVLDVLMRILGLKDVAKRVDGDLRILGIRVGCQKFNDRVDRLVAWLENCQGRALNYNYPDDNLTWEFLLKTRYRESRDNFISSFDVEPSSGSNNSEVASQRRCET